MLLESTRSLLMWLLIYSQPLPWNWSMKEYGNRTLRVNPCTAKLASFIVNYVFLGCRFWKDHGLPILFCAIFGCSGNSSSLRYHPWSEYGEIVTLIKVRSWPGVNIIWCNYCRTPPRGKKFAQSLAPPRKRTRSHWAPSLSDMECQSWDMWLKVESSLTR